MRPQEVIQWGLPLPEGPTVEGTYGDDYLVFQKLPEAGRHCVSGYWDCGILRDSIRFDKGYDIERSEEKEIRFQTKAIGWGTYLNGEAGRACGPPSRLLDTMSLGVNLLRLGRASRETAEKWGGLLVHPFSHRKYLMSLLYH